MVHRNASFCHCCSAGCPIPGMFSTVAAENEPDSPSWPQSRGLAPRDGPASETKTVALSIAPRFSDGSGAAGGGVPDATYDSSVVGAVQRLVTGGRVRPRARATLRRPGR